MVGCEYKSNDNICSIATGIAEGIPAVVCETECVFCLKQSKPKAINKATVAAAVGAAYKQDKALLQKIVDKYRPSIIGRAKNLRDAVVRDRDRGRLRVPEAVRAARLNACRSNQCGLYNSEKGWCRHPSCNCVMSRKTRWAAAECPVGIWGEWFPILDNGGSDGGD